MEEDPSDKEEGEEQHRKSAPVSVIEVPFRRPTVGKGVKARGIRSDLRSSLGDNESTLAFINGAC